MLLLLRRPTEQSERQRSCQFGWCRSSFSDGKSGSISACCCTAAVNRLQTITQLDVSAESAAGWTAIGNPTAQLAGLISKQKQASLRRLPVAATAAADLKRSSQTPHASHLIHVNSVRLRREFSYEFAPLTRNGGVFPAHAAQNVQLHPDSPEPFGNCDRSTCLVLARIGRYVHAA